METKYTILKYSSNPTDQEFLIGYLYEIKDFNFIVRDFYVFNKNYISQLGQFDPELDLELTSIAIDSIVENFKKSKQSIEEYIKPFVNSFHFDLPTLVNEEYLDKILKGKIVHIKDDDL